MVLGGFRSFHVLVTTVHLQNTVIVWDDTIIGEFACVTRRNKLANLCTPSIQHSSLVLHIVPTGQPTDRIQKGHIFKFYWKSINHSQENNVKTQYLGINLTLYSTHTHKHTHTHSVELSVWVESAISNNLSDFFKSNLSHNSLVPGISPKTFSRFPGALRGFL